MSMMAQRGSWRNLAQTWGNWVSPCRDTYLPHPCDLCSHHSRIFPFPRSWRSSPACHLLTPPFLPAPTLAGVSHNRVCVTQCDTFRTLCVQRRTQGILQRRSDMCELKTKTHFTVLCHIQYCTLGVLLDSGLWVNPRLDDRFSKRDISLQTLSFSLRALAHMFYHVTLDRRSPLSSHTLICPLCNSRPAGSQFCATKKSNLPHILIKRVNPQAATTLIILGE